FLGRRRIIKKKNRAAGGAAAGKGRTGSAVDFDLLGEEILADADAGIADAVEEDVVAGIEAADEEAVAKGVAALAGPERYAGGVQHGRLQGGRVLVPQD